MEALQGLRASFLAHKAQEVPARQQQAVLEKPRFKLAGLAIGNGLTAPAVQVIFLQHLLQSRVQKFVQYAGVPRDVNASAQNQAYCIGTQERNERHWRLVHWEVPCFGVGILPDSTMIKASLCSKLRGVSWQVQHSAATLFYSGLVDEQQRIAAEAIQQQVAHAIKKGQLPSLPLGSSK